MTRLSIDGIARHFREGTPIENITFKAKDPWDFSNIFFLNQGMHARIVNCVFEEAFQITKLKAPKLTIFFQNCDFRGGTNQAITESELFGVHFESCSFNNLNFGNLKLGDLAIGDCSSNGAIYLTGIESEYISLDWKDSEKQAEIKVSTPDVKQIQIVSNGNIPRIDIFETRKLSLFGSISEINIHDDQFDSIKITAHRPDFENNPNLVYNEIDIINMKHKSFTGSLEFDELKINTLKLANLQNSNGIVRFNELEIVKAFFHDITIKSFYWNQIHFQSFLRIERCDFSALKTANVKWLTGKKLSGSYINESLKLFYSVRKKKTLSDVDLMDLQYERETYRQLKSASTANNNHIEALDFYKNEMRLFWKEIRIKSTVSISDRILIFLNRWVSDFGQSWALPLMWLFLFHTLIYFCIIGFNFTIDFEAFRMGTGQYFELLNPVHKTPDYIKGFDVGLELLLRILDGFFIYHFIRATRKFGKV